MNESYYKGALLDVPTKRNDSVILYIIIRIFNQSIQNTETITPR